MTSDSDPSVRAQRPSSSSADVIVRFQPKAKTDSGASAASPPPQAVNVVPEIGGRKDGLEPTRYGDWEKDGRCIDF